MQRSRLKLVCFLVAGAIAFICAHPPEAAAETRPVVAVLYFDNNTGNAKYDVFKKGFADMLITDLSSSRSLVLVERERLQDILAELKLQRSRYINKETAIQLGKGLGAQYALTGSFISLEPKLRIDARLIDIRSGAVVLGTSVVGPSNEIFGLEQELVGKILKNLQSDSTASPIARTRVPNVGTVLEYSKGIELSDRGEYQRATRQLDRVVSKVPTFALARVRRKELMKRYLASQDRKTARREDAYAQLRDRVAAVLRASPPLHTLDRHDADRYLAYSTLHGQWLLASLRERLTAPRSGTKTFHRDRQRRNRALQIASRYVDHSLKLLKDLETYDQTFQQRPDASLDDADERLAKAATVTLRTYREPFDLLLDLADFALLGRAKPNIGKQRFHYAPPLGLVQPKIGRRILRRIKSAASQSGPTTGPTASHAPRAIELLARYNFLLDKRNTGVELLQSIIDGYPESSQARSAERRIEEELGLKNSHAANMRAAYQNGLKTCDIGDVNKSMGPIFHERMRRDGFPGVLEVIAEVEKHCGGRKKNGKPRLAYAHYYLYQRAGLIAADHGFCAEFERLMSRAVDLGFSRSEAATWRKNKGCDARSKP